METERLTQQRTTHHRVLSNNSDLIVMQTRKGCWQNLMGCDMNTEMTITTRQDTSKINYYAKEESNCCLRIFCVCCHPMKMQVSIGSEKGGAVFGSVSRDCTWYNPCTWTTYVHNCKCCCFQEFKVEDGTGAELGSFKERFFCCNPKFSVYQLQYGPEREIPEYDIRMASCCFDLCPNFCETYNEESMYIPNINNK